MVRMYIGGIIINEELRREADRCREIMFVAMLNDVILWRVGGRTWRRQLI